MLYREQEEICQPSESLFELTIEPPLTHYWALYVVTESGYELVLRSDEVQDYFPIPPNVIRTVNRCLVQGDYRFEFGPWYDPATYQVKLDGEVIAEANKTPVIASSRVFVATFSVFGEGMPVPGPPIPIPTPPTRNPISTPSPTPSPVSNDSDCVDVPAGWFDSTGDNCNWYAQDPLFCRNYGDSFENFGTTANKVGILYYIFSVQGCKIAVSKSSAINSCCFHRLVVLVVVEALTAVTLPRVGLTPLETTAVGMKSRTDVTLSDSAARALEGQRTR
jgi:hypothetical protein